MANILIPASDSGRAIELSIPVNAKSSVPATRIARNGFSQRTSAGTSSTAHTTDNSSGVRQIHTNVPDAHSGIASSGDRRQTASAYGSIESRNDSAYPQNVSLFYTYTASPVGDLLLAGSNGALQWLSFSAGSKAREPQPGWVPDCAPFEQAIDELQAYFAGKRKYFDLHLAPQGTPFQQQVWQQLLQIPYGQTISYGELAKRLGNPNASRAVGLANGSNPIAIIIPCHRVIGANGKLTGFGGGLPVKQKLLSLERGELALALE